MTLLKSKRILVVDDSDSIRLMSEIFLKRAGYIVSTANDGEECLSVVSSFQPDLILLDIMMPGIHGFDVLKQLKSDPAVSHIGIIICSGKDYKADIDTALRLGAFTFVTKPFMYDELLVIVNNYFTKSELSSPPLTPVSVYEPQPVVTGKKTTPFIRFWGTRGSIPVSGPAFIQYGGNTPCLEINNGQMTIIIDAGTGIRELGLKLMDEPQRPLHMFIGHTHWDHIQGFPFFVPAYHHGTSLTVYGASGFGKDLRSIFNGQLDADYFPVQLQDLPSSIDFQEMKTNPVMIGEFAMNWCYVHHQGATVGFKFVLSGKVIVYITDNEFLKGYLGTPDGEQVPVDLMSQYTDLIKFITDADLMISESQYTDEEYVNKIGWGHTSLSNASLLCKLGKVKRWVITHHDPMHTDEILNNKLLQARKILETINYAIPVAIAGDGMTEYF